MSESESVGYIQPDFVAINDVHDLSSYSHIFTFCRRLSYSIMWNGDGNSAAFGSGAMHEPRDDGMWMA